MVPLIEGILGVAFLCCLPFLGLYLWKLAWRDERSLYDRFGAFQVFLGENARAGVDAAAPAAGIVWGCGMALGGVLTAPELMGVSYRWPPGMVSVLGPLAFGLFWAGMLLLLSLLLFMFPRALATPYARDKRGWIPEWRYQRSLKRSGRGAHPRRSR